ncbi:hypothetical protein [Paenibacillus sp. GCM10012306]|uniref:hypothetical protein n=1 Tax=Paenibacillus sp. GCM10012306 TaxID=3317342 RepID=UPI003608CA9C
MSLLAVIVLSGCQNAFGYINAKWIHEISLAYHQLDQQSEQQAALVESKSISDAALIKTVAEAMNKSKRIQGELDYEPDFSMKLVYGDGYTEEYALGLGEEKGHKGLLVASVNSGKGYSIPVKYADKLRDVIFRPEGSDVEQPAASSVQAAVAVKGPVTLSRNELFPLTGREEYLNLRLLQGQYSEDWATKGPFSGKNWSGTFELVVTDAEDKVLSTFPLSRHFQEGLEFQSFFQLEFGDYNDDGDPDFTIGQYGSSNGYFFKLFSLGKDHVIRELPIQPTGEMFISSPERYSVKLDQADKTSFKTTYYDNSVGQELHALYQWNGTEFQRVAP